MKETTAKVCLNQTPARTASALVVAVADMGSWRHTTESQLDWMRRSGFEEKKISDYERKAQVRRWFFVQRWFGILGCYEVVYFPGGKPVDDYQDAPGLASGHAQVGDQEHRSCVRKPDNCGRGPGS